MVYAQPTLELFLLVITVLLSAMGVILGFDAKIFQRRTAIRESLDQLDPFVEIDPHFKISHSLSGFYYLSRDRGVVVLFRYISLYHPANAEGGHPRMFHEILKYTAAFPDPEILLEDVRGLEGVENAEFTDRGLSVSINSLTPVHIGEVVHHIQRVFRNRLQTDYIRDR